MSLEVSVVAPTRGLLTTAQLRAAAGLAASDASRDTELAAIGLMVADTISEWCNIIGDGITPVTLRQETLIETFYQASGTALLLARQFLGTVAVDEAGIALVSGTDFTIEGNRLIRRSGGALSCWSSEAIVVTYQAGFAIVPTPLADVASEMVARRAGSARDPMMRSERVEIPGVRTIDRSYWVDAADATDITPDMAAKLSRYRTLVV